MPGVLDYAPPQTWYRRYTLALLTMLALSVSYALAVPRFNTFRQHQLRRQEIRQQFKTELAAARSAMQTKDVDAAALALLHAEFDTQTERYLFRASEVEAFRSQVLAARKDVTELHRVIRLEEAAKAEAQAKAQEEADERFRRQGGIITRCYFAPNCDDGRRTLEVLENRAAAALRAGDNQKALPICEQIVLLDPAWHFDSDFWGNAGSK